MKETIDKLNMEGEPFVVKFTAKWCPGCKQIQPLLDNLKNDINIVIFDVDEDMEYPKSLGIRSIPTLIFFDKGQEKDRIVGITTKEKILETFNK
jgi:thioredoxin 1